MIKHIYAAGLMAALVATPAMAQEGGAAAGAAAGAVGGAIVGGPVGAVVGGAVGAAAGAGLSQEDRVYVQKYVTTHRRPTVRVKSDVRVGVVLPEQVEFYSIEGRPYRYAYVNGRAVVVEPSSRRVVYVVD